MVRTCRTGLDHTVVADSSSWHTHEPPVQLHCWKTVRLAEQCLLHPPFALATCECRHAQNLIATIRCVIQGVIDPDYSDLVKVLLINPEALGNA